jgi:UDP-arabinose 4-epimerase
MKNILVTGGAGFIGSHTCKALANAGYVPIVYDNLERGHQWAVKWGPFVKGDVGSDRDLERAFDKWKPDAVVHFAAHAYVGESVENPTKYYDTNVGGTAKLLAACAAFECKNFIFSSSCATYGIPTKLPLKEDHPQNPVNPYGFSKLVVERMLKDVETAHGIRHVVLRYFNAAGADPEGDLGEWHEPETHLIPSALFAAMGRQPSVKIFGNDYPTHDGTCIRDYVHVSDLADAHVAALKWLESRNESNAFNLGNGNGFSVNEVIRTIEKVTGLPIRTDVCPRRAGDPPMLTSDSTKARQILGWNPKYPALDQQIGHAWKWFNNEIPKLRRA